MAVNWAELPVDILGVIAKRVKVMEDFIAFGCVCTSWRAAAPKENFDGFLPQVPLLMLADEDDDYREFYSVSRGKVVSRGLYLPEGRGRKCFSTEWSWLLTVSTTGEYHLLHPFTRAQIQLPPRKDLLGLTDEEDKVFGSYCIVRSVLTANPSLTSDYVLVVLYNGGANIDFWRPGNPTWTAINLLDHWSSVANIMYFNAQFYAVTWGGDLCVFDVEGHSTPRLITLLDKDDIFDRSALLHYLIELSGALLLIVRFSHSVASDTFKFQVFELDLTKAELKEINTLGNSAIFVGLHGATSVDSSKFTGVKPNRIYFTDDWYEHFHEVEGGGGRDMGVYNLEDGKIESLYPGLSLSPICPPTWVAISDFSFLHSAT